MKKSKDQILGNVQRTVNVYDVGPVLWSPCFSMQIISEAFIVTEWHY